MITTLPNTYFLRENKVQKLKNIEPNEILSVFHGTTLKHAREFCLVGINGTELSHHSRTSDTGLFVSPWLQSAQKYGTVVIKFKALGKELKQAGGVRLDPRSIFTSELLFIGNLVPERIETIYYMDPSKSPSPFLHEPKAFTTFTREEFIKFTADGFPIKVRPELNKQQPKSAFIR
jgi:hypothetical protein